MSAKICNCGAPTKRDWDLADIRGKEFNRLFSIAIEEGEFPRLLRTTWRTIETAPKDGTRFLAYGKGCIDKIIYDPKADWNPMVTVCWRVLYDTYEDIPQGDNIFKRVAKAEDMGWKHGIHFRPTHWMPLPDSPIIETRS